MLCEVFIVTEQKKVKSQDTIQTHGGCISWASDSKARKWQLQASGGIWWHSQPLGCWELVVCEYITEGFHLVITRMLAMTQSWAMNSHW